MGSEAGRSGWGGGARLVERIRARFRGDAVAEEAMESVRRDPADAQAREELHRILLAHMLRDSAFENDVRSLLQETVNAQRARAPQVSAAVIKNAQVFNEKVEIKGDWNIN